MRHPTDGVLRRLLDEPAGVADPDRRHVADCPQCLARLETVRADAELVDAALMADSGADVSAAWQRLSTAGAAGGPAGLAGAPVRPAAGPAEPAGLTARPGGRVAGPGGRTAGLGRRAAGPGGRVAAPPTRRLRGVLRRPAVAATAVAIVVTGAGAAAATDWLPIFRTERIAPVSISTADLVALPDLSAYGEVRVTAQPDVHEVPDARTAAAQTGLRVPEVTGLPSGVRGEPVRQVGGRASVTFTFSAERAARTAAAAGATLPTPPPGLDGSPVRLDAGPGVAQVWRSGAGAPALVVGRAVAPAAFSAGIPFPTVRDYLLSLPGLPASVAEQLRAFSGDGATLPLPVPADRVTTATTQVGGAPATVLRTRDRTLAAVVWVADGTVTVVAGSLDPDELLTVARGLR